jgi:hypothetical protein
MPPRRYWLALHPDLRKPIGGIKQVHRLAEALVASGREAILVQQDATFHPGWFRSVVASTSLARFREERLDPQHDVIVLPETFLPALPSYAPGIPKVLFNQNGAYSFGLQPGDGFPDNPDATLDLYRHPDLRHVLCVSQHDQGLLTNGLGLAPERVSRLHNAVENDLFCPGHEKRRLVSWMPRKQARDGAIVAAMLQRQAWWSGWSLKPISGQPQLGVASILKHSLVFLAFGHPEGFGLPLAEALACGCYLIGYSGLGGRELFQLAADHHAGEEVAYGDWQGFLLAMERLRLRLDRDPGGVMASVLAASKALRRLYSPASFQSDVARTLPRLEAQL